ncbi:Peroxidase 2 [Zea mays]|uniref:Peroxidase n=1 Tax=Zea mays TaxID=4577 RepID=A0A3L6FY75_MAIZE|nr:Peroxidase 2 [Zea mays]
MANVAALTITLLGLLGSVTCQGSIYSAQQQQQASSSSSSSPGCILRGWIPFLPPCRDDQPPTPNPLPPPSGAGLTVGYYKNCPGAEGIVRKAVEKAMENGNRGIGAGLIRIFFHDCFVRGCDASVLLRNTSGSSDQTEMFGLPNINSLRGFQVIDDAKAELEKACPRTVSCADIVAFAARDATRNLSYGAIDFQMPAGRLDGRVSLKEEAEKNLPGPLDSLDDLQKSFAAQGLGFNDMVTLSGAHSIGVARCRFFTNRLPPNPSDMDRDLARSLKATCDQNGLDSKVVQDPVTPVALDNQYYKNVHNGKVLFTSDAALNSTDDARKVVDGFANNAVDWYRAFADAMVKMGNIRDRTINRPKPEIREKCFIYNTY